VISGSKVAIGAAASNVERGAVPVPSWIPAMLKTPVDAPAAVTDVLASSFQLFSVGSNLDRDAG
jgi:hypothetical protein